MLYLWNGYVGAVGCTGNEPANAPSGPCRPLESPDGMHTYLIPIGSQMQKDGMPFEVDWLNPTNGPAELNEIGAALLATYAPAVAQTASCLSDGSATGHRPGRRPLLLRPADRLCDVAVRRRAPRSPCRAS